MNPYFPLLTQAFEAEHGIRVRTDDRTRLRAKLYECRRDYPAFSDISFVFHPTQDDEIWLVRTKGTGPDASTED